MSSQYKYIRFGTHPDIATSMYNRVMPYGHRWWMGNSPSYIDNDGNVDIRVYFHWNDLIGEREGAD